MFYKNQHAVKVQKTAYIYIIECWNGIFLAQKEEGSKFSLFSPEEVPKGYPEGYRSKGWPEGNSIGLGK